MSLKKRIRENKHFSYFIPKKLQGYYLALQKLSFSLLLSAAGSMPLSFA